MLKVKRHFQAVSSVLFFTFSTSYRTILSPEGRVQKKYIKSLVFYQIVKYFSKIICHRYIKSVKPQNIKDFHWGFPAAMVLSYERAVCISYIWMCKVLRCLKLMHSLKQNIGFSIEWSKILHFIPISIFTMKTFNTVW